MTDEVKDGGAAFPNPGSSDGSLYPELGMSLRDWFAGQALTGLLSGQYNHTSSANLSEVPDEAYKIADAMIYARKEQTHD